jgi:hypothetical protein
MHKLNVAVVFIEEVLVGYEAGLDTVAKRKILLCWELNPSYPACSLDTL